ncbi:MAG: GNAT family N-acetyltransferase [Firmicutes bacterium]|nr:GNAT family N-acetyltransferase [Bacillota bacterium]
MKHKYYAEYKNIKLRPLEEKDIEQLRIWRNDLRTTRFLRPIGQITKEMQVQWFENYIKDDEQIIFAIDEISELNRMVGSLALYDLKPNSDTCEIGKIQIGDLEAHGKGIGRCSFVMAMKIAVEKLNIKNFVAEVHRDNIAARTNYFKIGFRIIGEQLSVAGGIEDKIEITAEELRNINYYNNIKITK